MSSFHTNRKSALQSSNPELYNAIAEGNLSALQKAMKEAKAKPDSILRYTENGTAITITGELALNKNTKAIQAIGARPETSAFIAPDMTISVSGYLALSGDIKAIKAIGGRSDTMASINKAGMRTNVVAILADKKNPGEFLKAIGAKPEDIALIFPDKFKKTVSALLLKHKDINAIKSIGGNAETTTFMGSDGLKLTIAGDVTISHNSKLAKAFDIRPEHMVAYYPDGRKRTVASLQSSVPSVNSSFENVSKKSWVKHVKTNPNITQANLGV